MIEVGGKLYHHGVICVNGHVITFSLNSLDDYYDKYCQKCGSQTITSCPSCNNPILGWSYNPDVVVIADVNPSPFCRFCGKPFPWAAKKNDIEEKIDSSSNLSDEEKKSMKNNLGAIISESPQTKTATENFVESLKKVGKQAAKEIRSLTVEISSETAKKIFLHYAGEK